MSKRIITFRSGNEEISLEVTEEEYLKFYRPWWQQKKREQRNREAMAENGYTEESYEAWRDKAAEEIGIPDMELPDMDSAGRGTAEARLRNWLSAGKLDRQMAECFVEEVRVFKGRRLEASLLGRGEILRRMEG